MFEGLDAIDWKSLTHAYGEATDVPDLLRSLLSPNAGQREETIDTLFGSIWHQGTVYPATAAAVPFLYELLAGADVPCKVDVVSLLTAIAEGHGYLEIHAVGEYGEATWREILAKQGKSLEEEMKREREEIASVRRAISAGLPQLIPYLQHSEPDIRRYVAVALGNYPEHADLSVDALQAALASEKDDFVREGLQDSVKLLKAT